MAITHHVYAVKILADFEPVTARGKGGFQEPFNARVFKQFCKYAKLSDWDTYLNRAVNHSNKAITVYIERQCSMPSMYFEVFEAIQVPPH